MRGERGARVGGQRAVAARRRADVLRQRAYCELPAVWQQKKCNVNYVL